MNRNKEDRSWKDYFGFGEVVRYFFRKKDPGRKMGFNLRMMHGINRISIIMFLIAIIILIVRNLFFR